MSKQSSSPQNELTLPKIKMETHLFSFSSNTSWVCPPPATGAAVAAALIAASEDLFAGALFTTGGFTISFFGHCFGIRGVFTTEQTGGVDCTPAAGPTADACSCPTTCVPILFHFEPATAPATVPPGAVTVPPSTLDAAVGVGPNWRLLHAG
jgi:hypothetical protein